MVRPRTGDFLYSDSEIDVMQKDIRLFKDCGVCGIVVGILNKDGRVNIGSMKRFTITGLLHDCHLTVS